MPRNSLFPNGVSRTLVDRRPMVRSATRSNNSYSQFVANIDDVFALQGRYSGLVSNATAFRESPWVQPSIHAFAAACASRPFAMFEQVGEDKERIQSHWLIDLMSRPNPMARLSEYSLKYWTFALYDYDGEVFWHLGRTGKSKTPDFITVFRKSEAIPTFSRNREFTGWDLQIEGVPNHADREDVIHFPQFDPLRYKASFDPFRMRVLEPTRGLSSLDSKRRAISTDLAMSRYNSQYFERGPDPNLILIGPAGMSPSDRDLFEERLKQRMAGDRKPLVLGGDFKAQELSGRQKDSEFIEGRKLAREETIAGRVPPLFMGEDDATYANAQAQLIVFWENIIIPGLTHFCASLDTNLLQDEPNVWSMLTTDDVYALQIAKQPLVTSAIDLSARGRVPMEIAAQAVGLELEVYEGSDVAFGSALDVPVERIIAGAPATTATTSTAADSMIAATNVSLTVEQAKEVTAIVIAVESKQIPRDAGVGQAMLLYGLTKDQAEQIMGSAGTDSEPVAKPAPAPADTIAVAATPDESRFFRVSDGTRPILRVVETPSLSDRIAQIVEEDDSDLNAHMRRFRSRMFREGARQALKLIRSEAEPIGMSGDERTQTQWMDVAGNLAACVNVVESEGHDATANAVRDFYNGLDKDARSIARSESVASVNRGIFQQLAASKVVAVEWVAGRAEDSESRSFRSTEPHAANLAPDGEIVRLGETFSNGCRFPLDPNGARDHIRGCTCTLIPVADGGTRGSLIPKEKERAAHWRSVIFAGTRETEEQFRVTLQKLYNVQRGKVLAAVADHFESLERGSKKKESRSASPTSTPKRVAY